MGSRRLSRGICHRRSAALLQVLSIQTGNPEQGPMFRGLGYASVSLPPLVVFILEALELMTKVTVPVPLLVATYPLGISTLVIYCLAFKRGISINHYLEFANGARN